MSPQFASPINEISLLWEHRFYDNSVQIEIEEEGVNDNGKDLILIIVRVRENRVEGGDGN